MKLNHIIALLLIFFVYPFNGYSQIEDEPFIDSFSDLHIRENGTLDFGVIKIDPKIIKFEIQNSGKADMKIGRIAIPEGVGVFVLKEVINPGEKGEIAILIDPKYIKHGDFKKEISIYTISEENGISVMKTVTFYMKGLIL
jgi:hypothetical protein